MAYLPDVNVEQTPQNDDNVVINRGRRTIQMPYADFIAGVGAPVFPNNIDATSGNYVLVAQSTHPMTIIYMLAGDTLTLPASSLFTDGAIYRVVCANSASGSIAINLTGTALNVTSLTAIGTNPNPGAADGDSYADFFSNGGVWTGIGNLFDNAP